MNPKPFYQSKTLWVQLVSILSILFPPVQQWVANNPVETTAIFAAVNTLVRFITSGKIAPFKSTNKFPVVGVVMGAAAVFFGFLSLSCSTLSRIKVPEGVKTSLDYESPRTGMRYGVECDDEGCRGTIALPKLEASK